MEGAAEHEEDMASECAQAYRPDRMIAALASDRPWASELKTAVIGCGKASWFSSDTPESSQTAPSGPGHEQIRTRTCTTVCIGVSDP